MSEHSPLPWRLKDGILGPPIIINGERNIAKVLYDIGSEDREVHANAAFIVKAVNGHDRLVEALEGIANLPPYTDLSWAVGRAKEALAAVKESTK